MTNTDDTWWFAAAPALGKVSPGDRRVSAANNPYGALAGAPGVFLHRENRGGDITVRDMTNILRAFARDRALLVARWWNIPASVEQYLETGEEEIRHAAFVSVRAESHYYASYSVAFAACMSAYAAIYKNTCIIYADEEAIQARASNNFAVDAVSRAAQRAVYSAQRAVYPVMDGATFSAAQAADSAARADARAAAKKKFNQMAEEIF